MAIPVTYAPIKPPDFTLTPFRVNREFTIDQNDTGSGYKIREGLYSGIITPISTSKAENDPKNDDGTFKHVIWQSFDGRYYSHPYTPGKTLELDNKNRTYKYLGLTASFMSTPYLDRGEGIKKGTVTITNSDLGITAKDDKDGNLYDTSISTASFYPRYKTVAHWGFSNLYRDFKRGYGLIPTGTFKYNSYTNEVQFPSQLKNVYVDNDRKLENCVTLKFESGSYISTQHIERFQFDNEEEFLFSFWVYPTGDGEVISKRGVRRNLKRLKNSDTSSFTWNIENEETDKYPYNIRIESGSVLIDRTDGLRTVNLTGSIHYNEWNLITFSRYLEGNTPRVGLRYRSGSLYTSSFADDNTDNPFNNNFIHFGASNLSREDGFEGNLAELRLVKSPKMGDFHPESGSISTSSYTPHDYPYNTNIIGNVFYSNGEIVVSSHYDEHRDLISGSWDMTYKGINTIYQYEALVRIKKGDFNLTMNPSARKSPKSHELLDNFTGSLTPYATTVGIYGDDGELLVVGKLGQPVKMRDDVDINILMRFDF